jgi:hypothetical protein
VRGRRAPCCLQACNLRRLHAAAPPTPGPQPPACSSLTLPLPPPASPSSPPCSAAAEAAAADAAAPEYERLFRSYLSLCSAAGHRPDPQLAPPSLLDRIASAAPSAADGAALLGGGGTAGLLAGPEASGDSGGRGGGGGGRGRGRGRGGGAAAAGRGPPRRAGSDDGAGGAPGPVAGAGSQVTAADGSELPQELPVTCNGTPGVLRLQELRVECECGPCARLPVEQRLMSMTQFEVHCGLATAKKWRASVRVGEEAAPGGLTIGRWFEINGIETRGGRTGAARG